MKARFLRSACLDQLRSSIASNLSLYRGDGFGYLEADPAFWFEHETEVDVSALDLLKRPEGKNFYEVENCSVLYSALKNLSPYDARDERLWVYLSHTKLAEHARHRWPIPESDLDAVNHIAKHWFARDRRQAERDQVGSRLWWMGHLCARINNIDSDLVLRAFLFRSDVRANLVERPTVSQSVELFNAIVQRLVASFNGKKVLYQRSAFRRFMVEVNSVGGYRLLDCLPSTEIELVLEKIISNKLNLKEL